MVSCFQLGQLFFFSVWSDSVFWLCKKNCVVTTPVFYLVLSSAAQRQGISVFSFSYCSPREGESMSCYENIYLDFVMTEDILVLSC